MIERHDGITEVWAKQVPTIENEADSDLMEFTVTRAHRVVNHLVCAGEGELSERVVVDLYADSSGNISQTQTFSGVDEVALYYNYSGANQADLISDGTKKLKEYQTNGGAEIGEVGKGDWHVGNVLQVRDNNTGTVVDAIIAKKIVKVERGVLTVDYEIGDHIAAEAASFNADLSGIAEQPVAVALNQIKPKQYNVLSLVSQTNAEQANFEVTAALLEVSGYVAQLRVSFHAVSALTAGTEYTIGTIGSAIRPALGAQAGIGARRLTASLNTAGQMVTRPIVNISASTTTTYAFNSTYILASAYTG